MIHEEIFEEDLHLEERNVTEKLLQALSGLESIILLNYDNITFPEPQEPTRVYDADESMIHDWLSLELPTSFEAYSKEAFRARHSAHFQASVGERRSLDGFPQLKKVNVYRAEAPEYRFIGSPPHFMNNMRFEYYCGQWARPFRSFSDSDGISWVKITRTIVAKWG